MAKNDHQSSALDRFVVVGNLFCPASGSFTHFELIVDHSCALYFTGDPKCQGALSSRWNSTRESNPAILRIDLDRTDITEILTLRKERETDLPGELDIFRHGSGNLRESRRITDAQLIIH